MVNALVLPTSAWCTGRNGAPTFFNGTWNGHPPEPLWGVRMRLWLFIGAAVLMVACSGCSPFGFKVRSSRFQAEMDFETDLRDEEVLTRHTWERIEASWIVRSGEFFVDFGTIEIDDRGDERLDADGYGFGFGVRTAPPDEAGWNIDVGVRLGFHELDFGREADPVDPDWDYEGFDADVHVGTRRSFDLGRDLLFSLRGGVYLKEMSENLGKSLLHAGLVVLSESGSSSSSYEDGRKADVDHDDSEYVLSSMGLYLGTQLNFASSDCLDVTANIFVGTDRMKGVCLTAAVRF
jgi:hypothetical protein